MPPAYLVLEENWSKVDHAPRELTTVPPLHFVLVTVVG